MIRLVHNFHNPDLPDVSETAVMFIILIWNFYNKIVMKLCRCLWFWTFITPKHTFYNFFSFQKSLSTPLTCTTTRHIYRHQVRRSFLIENIYWQKYWPSCWPWTLWINPWLGEKIVASWLTEVRNCVRSAVGKLVTRHQRPCMKCQWMSESESRIWNQFALYISPTTETTSIR